MKTFWEWLDSLSEEERSKFFDCNLAGAGEMAWNAAIKETKKTKE